jgi:class 3 adenylate cyclase
MKAAAPSGVVTFLFTDIEGSTRRWEADAEAMRAALAAHDKVLRTAIEAYDGFLFATRATVSWRPSRRRCPP